MFFFIIIYIYMKIAHACQMRDIVSQLLHEKIIMLRCSDGFLSHMFNRYYLALISVPSLKLNSK